MVDSLWLLLLPLAAGSGWWAAKRDQKRQTKTGKYDLPSAYFEGLNFLLNEQPDKAIEVFLKVLEIDSETVEMHLALGNLFRRRGEIERATRIHQNLIARPNLNKLQREQALFELGQDYFKAGLLDRAESLFIELLEVDHHSEQAFVHLLQIYEQEKEWEKGIAVARRLARASGRDLTKIIAQYYCELAEASLNEEKAGHGRRYVELALKEDKNCVRASMQLGDIEAASGDHKKALKIWEKIEDSNPGYMGEVVEVIADCYRQFNEEAGLKEFLTKALEKHNNTKLVMVLVDILEKQEGNKSAELFLANWVRQYPSVQALHRLIKLKMDYSEEKFKLDLSVLEGMMEKIIEKELGYECKQCGFYGKSLHWQCPGCRGWNTIEPIFGAYN